MPRNTLGLLDTYLQRPKNALRYIEPDFYDYATKRGYGGLLSPLRPDYGLREDGTHKGNGWLGLLGTAASPINGEVMSEKSIGVDFGNGETTIPSIVPGLTPEEIRYLQMGGDPGKHPAIFRKAADHALSRMREGKSPFID